MVGSSLLEQKKINTKFLDMKQSNFEERLHHAIENQGTRPQFLYDDRDLTGFESSMDLLSSKMLKKAEDQKQ